MCLWLIGLLDYQAYSDTSCGCHTWVTEYGKLYGFIDRNGISFPKLLCEVDSSWKKGLW